LFFVCFLFHQIFKAIKQFYTFVFVSCCYSILVGQIDFQIAAIENSAPTSGTGKSQIELERKIEELKRQLADAAAASTAGGTTAVGGARKKSVKFAEPEPVITSSETSSGDLESKIANLERALEDAAKERQEILEAAEREIEYHRSIAADLEQSLIEDFEWKLHEIEADFHKRLHEGDNKAAPAPVPSTSTLKSRYKTQTSGRIVTCIVSTA